MAQKDKAQYAKPASQLDLEARLENGNKSDRVLSTSDNYEPPTDSGDGRDFRVEDNDISEYVGVSPEYATYANETEAPLASDEEDSAEQQVFDAFADGLNPTVPEGWSASETEEETTAEPADSADDETPDGAPVPQSATTSSTAKKAASSSSS